MTDTISTASTASVRRTGTPTKIAAIEDQLTELWRQTVGGDEGNVASDAVLRATTLNLLIHTDAPDVALSALEQLAELHPCRAIILTGGKDTAEDAPMLATPALLLHPAFGREIRSQVMCEVITLQDGHEALERLASAALGLLLADSPTVLWKFMTKPSEQMSVDPIIKTLAHALDAIIVDSAGVGRTTDSLLQVIVSLRDVPNFRGSVYDLNWARVQGWRSALSQQFDPANDRVALGSALSVEVEHHAAYNTALLLLGWLIDRLGWHMIHAGDSPNTWIAQSASGSIALSLKEDPGTSNTDMACINRVSIHTPNRTYSTEYAADDGCFALISNDHRAVLASAILDTTALVNLTLDIRGRDALYEQALAQAIHLSGQGENAGQRAAMIVVEDANALSHIAARELAQIARQAVKENGRFTLALSGGSTPRALYEVLSAEPYRSELPWAQIHFFWGDERNVPPDHPDSNQRMAQESLLSRVPVPPGNIHTLLVGQLSAADAAARYAAEIRAIFGIRDTELPQFDLILLGLGEDGHTASLFPHTSALRAPGTALFVANSVPQLNATRLTLTADVINNASHVFFLVSGEKKADILYNLIRGPYRPDEYPSQRIRPAVGALTVIADQGAARRLQVES